jgi:hypothetical protein
MKLNFEDGFVDFLNLVLKNTTLIILFRKNSSEHEHEQFVNFSNENSNDLILFVSFEMYNSMKKNSHYFKTKFYSI